MNKSIYKISFYQTANQLNDEYEKLSEHEKEWISELDADGFFDFEEDGRYVCFLISTPIEVKKYLNILSSNLITFEYLDLSKDILSFKVDLADELKYQVSTLNSIKFSFFIDDVDLWILDSLDIDMVLDRISSIGIDNLSHIEKEFLSKYHQSL